MYITSLDYVNLKHNKYTWDNDDDDDNSDNDDDDVLDLYHTCALEDQPGYIIFQFYPHNYRPVTGQGFRQSNSICTAWNWLELLY